LPKSDRLQGITANLADGADRAGHAQHRRMAVPPPHVLNASGMAKPAELIRRRSSITAKAITITRFEHVPYLSSGIPPHQGLQ
jgi:hypothetical protein